MGDMIGTTPLHVCARDGVVFTDIIKSLRINTNVKDSNGRFPLHMAAIGGHGDACRALISLGADINAVDSDGATALHLAAESEEGITAINSLCESGKCTVDLPDSDGQLALHRAAQAGVVGNVIALCEVVGGQTCLQKQDKQGNTPVHEAAKVGALQAVRAMISKQAKTDILNDEGLDTFGIALKSGDKALRVVNFLLQKEIGSLKLRYGKEERTPLHIAAIGGSEMIVLALLESMGDKKSKAQLKFINKEDSNGETAFVLACKNGNSNVVKVLLDLKCEPQADVIIDKERMYS